MGSSAKQYQNKNHILLTTTTNSVVFFIPFDRPRFEIDVLLIAYQLTRTADDRVVSFSISVSAINMKHFYKINGDNSKKLHIHVVSGHVIELRLEPVRDN